MQPASFTDAGSALDLPEDLPASCKGCDAKLPAEAWLFEVCQYSKRDVDLVWTQQCDECGYIVTVTK